MLCCAALLHKCTVVAVTAEGMETVQVIPLRRTLAFSPYRNRHALLAIRKGMCAVKRCSSKIIQFLTGDAS